MVERYDLLMNIPLPKPFSAHSTRFQPREIVVAALALAIIELAWLVIDHTLRLYMGDSMMFVLSSTRLTGVASRSFLYGWTLYLVPVTATPMTILCVQTFWSALSALGLFVFLRHAIGLRFLASLIPALLFAVEPAQVFLVRLLMAETYGLLAFVCTLLVLARYLHNGKLGWYLLACLGGLATASIRTSLLPVVIGLCTLAPIIHVFLRRAPAIAVRPPGWYIPAALAILLTCHVGYMHAYGWATKQPPGYLATTGMMRIGLVAPLIRAEDFAGTGVPGTVLDQVRRPLDDHWQRGNHIWMDDGLWRVLENNSRDPEMVARTITRRAMLRNPIGLLRINIETLAGYFDPHRSYWRMLDDIGVIAPSRDDIALVRTAMHWDPSGVNQLETPARRYFAASKWWLTACLFLLAPLALATLVIGWRTPNREQYVLLAMASLGLVASHLLFAHIISYRYLHPFPWFVLANLAVIIDGAWRHRQVPAPRPGRG